MSNSVLIAGSVAYVNTITLYATGNRILGGSAPFESIAYNYFSKPFSRLF
ncbi:MAG: hypothetical protein O7C75_15790 [Verrucomicrobia bacterium]|nr:hypothetical protein [Verrucomicrobiota bacterium]